MTSSADVWRAVAERQQRFGNSRHVMETATGQECLEGSMSRLGLSSGQARRARRDFVRVVGERPSPFNDFRSRNAGETALTARHVAHVLEVAEKPSAVASGVGGRKGLPVGQSWLDGCLSAPQRDMEAAR